jgi:hypothetical protein
VKPSEPAVYCSELVERHQRVEGDRTLINARVIQAALLGEQPPARKIIIIKVFQTDVHRKHRFLAQS